MIKVARANPLVVDAYGSLVGAACNRRENYWATDRRYLIDPDQCKLYIKLVPLWSMAFVPIMKILCTRVWKRAYSSQSFEWQQ